MATFQAKTSEAGEGEPTASLRGLTLSNFRNFETLEIALPPAGVAIVGPNGSGKTNLLEAIYYLEIFRSFRGARDRELVRFGQDVFRVEAELEGADPRLLAAAYERSGRRKKVEADGREADRLSEAIGRLGAVVFRLEDVEVVRSAPAERRRFLDILLSLVRFGYLTSLQRYRAALTQRNEALRDGARAEVVDAWTEGLVAPGAQVMDARARWVSERASDFSGYHDAISGAGGATLAYEASVGGGVEVGVPGRDGRSGSVPATEAWEEAFRRALADTAERERRRGLTVVGPHRDDLSFRAAVAGEGERDLRTYGSAGQQRTAALSLRLVEADTLRDRLGHEPLYLLDDVFAELDEDRSRRLLSLLDRERSGQVILTAPKAGELELRGGSLDRWGIRNGRILR